MAEDTWTSLEIGGTIPQNLLDELAELVENEFGDLECVPSDAICDAINDKTSVNFTGNVNWGNPNKVCTFCQEHDLTYWLWCDSGYEWSSNIKVWTPELAEHGEQSIGADSQDRRPLASFEEIMQFEAIAPLKAWLVAYTQEAVPPLVAGPPHLTEGEKALATAEGA